MQAVSYTHLDVYKRQDKEGFLRSETSMIQTIGRAARNAHGQVIMYADEITGSMERAITETERRRAKQQAYNEAHGIICLLYTSLEYTNGVFTRGSTRGDGFVGEDVTANLMTIANIPKKLEHAPAFLEVRGEVYMPRKSFAALVEQQELNGETPAKNPRNAAAGLSLIHI